MTGDAATLFDFLASPSIQTHTTVALLMIAWNGLLKPSMVLDEAAIIPVPIQCHMANGLSKHSTCINVVSCYYVKTDFARASMSWHLAGGLHLRTGC